MSKYYDSLQGGLKDFFQEFSLKRVYVYLIFPEVPNALTFGHPTENSGWSSYTTSGGAFGTGNSASNFSHAAYSDINSQMDNGFSTGKN